MSGPVILLATLMPFAAAEPVTDQAPWSQAEAAQATLQLERNAYDFGGAWVDSQRVLHVASESGNLTPSSGKRVVTHHVAYSRAELLSDAAQIEKEHGSQADIALIGVDDRNNRVAITVRSMNGSFATQLRSRYGNRVLLQRGEASAAVGTLPTSTFSVPAGTNVNNGSYRCTAAFNLDYSNSAILNQPRAYFLTANHCFTLNASLQNSSGMHVGTVTKEAGSCAANCHADVEQVAEYVHWSQTFWGVSTNRLVNGVRIRAVDYGPYVVGNSYCKYGATSGTSCGTIQQTGLKVCYTGAGCYLNMLLVSNDYCLGDSGGPVYRGNSAAGIVSGRTYSTSTPPACGGARGLASTMNGVRAGGFDLTLIDITDWG